MLSVGEWAAEMAASWAVMTVVCWGWMKAGWMVASMAAKKAGR